MNKSIVSIIRCDWIRIISAIFILIFCCRNETKASPYEIPFAPGEKLTFQLSWSFIPAGEAVLEVKPTKMIDGIQAYHFVLTARSNAFVDVFYKVRDRIDSYVDLNMTRSLLYKKEQHEGSTKRDVMVNFNWANHTAQYFNFSKMEKTITIMPGSFDPLSVFYYSRLLALKVDEMITSPVTDGKKCIIGKAKIVKKEKISLANGTHDAYLLEPELKHIGGVFEKSEGAKIQLWVSADRRRIPLKIKSKVVVGSFVGELVSVEGVIDP
jgi:hypothetical protein